MLLILSNTKPNGCWMMQPVQCPFRNDSVWYNTTSSYKKIAQFDTILSQDDDCIHKIIKRDCQSLFKPVSTPSFTESYRFAPGHWPRYCSYLSGPVGFALSPTVPWLQYSAAIKRKGQRIINGSRSTSQFRFHVYHEINRLLAGNLFNFSWTGVFTSNYMYKTHVNKHVVIIRLVVIWLYILPW